MSTYATPIPGAPGYAQANLLARRAYDNAMARLAHRRSQSLLRAGYVRDAQGNLSVDPNNEYGGYQQMLRGQSAASHALDRRQQASGWDADSGYLGAQREDLQYGQGGQQAKFGSDLASEMFDIAQGEQDAAYGRDQALWQNEEAATQRAIENEQFNPANYDGIDVPYGDAEGPRDTGRLRPVRPRPNVHQRNRARLIRRAAARRAGRRR